MFMPFGKHKGAEIEQLPHDYLQWMVENLTDKPDLVAAAQAALGEESFGGEAGGTASEGRDAQPF